MDNMNDDDQAKVCDTPNAGLTPRKGWRINSAFERILQHDPVDSFPESRFPGGHLCVELP